MAFLAGMGLPGLCWFVAELLILLGAYSVGAASTATVAALAAVLLATGFLWTYQRIFMGAARPEHSNVARLSVSEKWILAVLGILALGLGLAPNFVLEPMRLWVEYWVRMG